MILEVDVSKLLPRGVGDVDMIATAIIPDVVTSVRTRIVAMAQEELGISAEDYVQAVQEPVFYFPSGNIPKTGSVKVASISLVGQIPNMIEHGWPGGDMKPSLLAGPNARTTQSGIRMNVVPFRHATPDSKGRVAPRMGSAYEKEGVMDSETAARLGKAVNAKAKRLEATITNPQGGGTQWGGRLEAGLAPLLRPHHKTDIYAGMVRQSKVYKKTAQSTYTTFRAVSENSDPRSWIHPGIKAHRFFDRASQDVDKIVSRLFDAGFQAVSKATKK